MSYFDASYFDGAYFDSGGSALGHPHGFWKGWDTRNVEMPSVPAWQAMAERKRRRIEEEAITELIRLQDESRRRRMNVSLALGFEVTR